MFQTGIHVALQTLASDWLTWLMLQVTATGYYWSVVAMVIAVMFGISLRKGFLLFQVVAVTVRPEDMGGEADRLGPVPLGHPAHSERLGPVVRTVVPVPDQVRM